MENENDTIESTNDTEETVNQDTNEESDETLDDSEKDKVIKTLEAQKEHWRKKAMNASKSPETVVTSMGDLSQKDLYAMVKADVSEEDFDEVVEFAKFKKISVSEALKLPVLKTILSDKSEQRKSALATSTGSSRRSNAKLSDEALLENANKGIMPDSDEDIRRLASIKRK